MPSKAIIAISFAGFIVAAAAPSAGQAEVRFRYSQDDLETVGRTRVLYAQIENRAATSCELTSLGPIPRRNVEAACAAQVIDDIVAVIGDVRLNRVHAQAQNGSSYAGK